MRSSLLLVLALVSCKGGGDDSVGPGTDDSAPPDDSSSPDDSTAPDDSATDDSATDDSATDDSATDDSATDDSATDDSATDDSATDDSATDDSGCTKLTFYRDADGDGYGADADTKGACTPPPGYVATAGDCDDAHAEANPAMKEICDNGLDDDCDGAACALPGAIDLATDAAAVLVGNEAYQQTGHSVAGVGDVDGDGVGDVLVGSYDEIDPTEAGKAYFVRGPVSGTLDLGSADATLEGVNALDGAGVSVAGPGDLDGDGYKDLLVGARTAFDGKEYVGATYVVEGPVSGTVSLDLADFTLVGETANSYPGHSVAWAGDTDGDGNEDILVGAYLTDKKGAAYLVRGPVSGTLSISAADATMVGEADYDVAGESVSEAGDVDGDGFADILVGASLAGADNNGAAYLLRGPVDGTIDLSAADVKFIGEGVGDYAGDCVSGAGDVDGDGLADVLIGASARDADAGVVYLVAGPVADSDLSVATATLTGPGVARDGYTAVDAGDVNADGHADILIGGEPSTQYAYLVLGPISGASDLSAADTIFDGGASAMGGGRSLSAAGDVSGDGNDDLLIGARSAEAASAGVDAPGVVYVVNGAGL